MRPTKYQAGFTLVEILVVLIVAGLVSGILLQALSQIYKVQGRFGQQLAQSQEGAMRADWVRQVIQGLQTDVPLGKNLFKGTDSSFEGMSITPFSTDYGAPARVALKIDYDRSGDVTRLEYVSGEKRTVLITWIGKSGGKFVYLDANGDRHEQWPPALGQSPQLPAAILLQPPFGSDQQVLVAVPRGSNEAKRPDFRLGETP